MSRKGHMRPKLSLALGASLAAFAAGLGGQAAAQDIVEEEEIVVTGFRASLQSAMNLKRRSSGVVDVIKAEDIADFPDANLAESIQRGGEVRPFLDQDVDGGRDLLERTVDHLALVGERPSDAAQLLDGRNDVLALLGKDPDEIVEPGEQFADLGLTPREGCVHVVDDVTDLAESSAVGDGGQRREGLLSGGIRGR